MDKNTLIYDYFPGLYLIMSIDYFNKSEFPMYTEHWSDRLPANDSMYKYLL